MYINLGTKKLDLSSPKVMGVLNVTPDSFSDGEKFFNSKSAFDQALLMIEEGASIIDVGGESTRPGSYAVSSQEQIDRIIPVIEFLKKETNTIISVDTGNAHVIRVAINAGAEFINDVYGLSQTGVIESIAQSSVGVCIMHMQGNPSTMQENPSYKKLPEEIIHFFNNRIKMCMEAGIQRDRITIDPGFGFGKNDEHNLCLLTSLKDFHKVGQPIMVGFSRKGMLGGLTGQPVDQRLAAGIAAAVIAIKKGANIIRTHDVASTIDAIKVAQAIT